MIRKTLFVLTGLVAASFAFGSSGQAQMIYGGHVVGHSSGVRTFSGGYPGAPVYTYQEPLGGGIGSGPKFNGYLNEPVLSARTVTSAGTWPDGAYNTPAPINYATVGPNQRSLYGWNSFWLYDPSQGSPIWNPYNRGRY
jgi:hypothetical protein